MVVILDLRDFGFNKHLQKEKLTQVNAWQVVLLSHFLCTEVFLHCNRVICSPFDSSIVCNNNTFHPIRKKKPLNLSGGVQQWNLTRNLNKKQITSNKDVINTPCYLVMHFVLGEISALIKILLFSI